MQSVTFSPTLTPLARAIGLSLAMLATGVLPASPAIAAETAGASNAQSYHIAPGSLSRALSEFASAAGVALSFNASQFGQARSAGLQGRFTVEQGFGRLLAGTGLVAAPQGDGSYVLQSGAASDAMTLNTVDVVGRMDDAQYRDQDGYDAVYDKDLSTTYAGKETIERFKGAAPADMFRGMLNVYTGDARNSGGLDPNIRGIQGPGRVPLTIDGTEQAITVWRGYMGANNRNYIDPNLIGGLQVYKGPNLERGVQSGVGGAVVASTLNVHDILKPGETVGGELKIEGSNNSVSPRVPALSGGQSYLDIPGFETPPGWVRDPTLLVTPEQGGAHETDDYAYRLALGTRQEHFDLMGAYAYRKKGNHFSGKKESGFYSSGKQKAKQLNYIPNLANIYQPGDEVPNTSSEMESWLAKATWRPTDSQSVQLGYRNTEATYGEILSSRVAWHKAAEDGVPQWPLSTMNTQAYNLEYKYQPQDNRWVDFYSNVWMTDTDSATYSAGGFPNDPYQRPRWGQDPREVDTRLRNTSVRHATETRKGVTLSNTLTLADNLDLTLGGRFQHEKLGSGDSYDDPALKGAIRMLPKAGKRQEREFDFNFDWQPVSRVTINAGMRYASAWTFDSFRDERVKAGESRFIRVPKTLGVNYIITHDRPAVYDDVKFWVEDFYGNPATRESYESQGIDVDALIQAQLDKIGTIIEVEKAAFWSADENGKFHSNNHPCLTTDIKYTKCTDGSVWSQGKPEVELVDIKEVKKEKHNGWVPMLSVAVDTSDNGRFYARHAQAYRFPSLFENTLGFSGSIGAYSLEPEHAFNNEVGYVHNLAGILNADLADIKLSYYHHRTKNVIERTPHLRFSNIEQHTLQGVELQGRYDNGRFFGDFSLAYNFENEVCDEHSSVQLDWRRTDHCVEQGYVGGYLVSMGMPKYTANLTLGGRFFNEQLELGTRTTYYHKHENVFDANYQDPGYITYYANTPLAWDTILLFDAYASYRFNDSVTLDITGTNLTNEYYVDPMTRTATPAPGRTMKLGLTARF
ncbi:TonB-dependent receptor [Oceanimonas baumannii]|uniref:TonB-dependent receptor n=1 Tax=Oceanimonas baumannii TaxID=129578 RepID=UPI001D18F0FF|nr:TonB-dependent receptor [Oceanimonas baumannii]MCC4264476.1 TonB-dependent receptor [Oceanimonas baumannii]